MVQLLCKLGLGSVPSVSQMTCIAPGARNSTCFERRTQHDLLWAHAALQVGWHACAWRSMAKASCSTTSATWCVSASQVTIYTPCTLLTSTAPIACCSSSKAAGAACQTASAALCMGCAVLQELC